jgi:hypothetical protein
LEKANQRFLNFHDVGVRGNIIDNIVYRYIDMEWVHELPQLVQLQALGVKAHTP